MQKTTHLSRLAFYLALLLPVVSAAGIANASEGAHGSEGADVMALTFFSIVNFLIYLVVLTWVYAKKVKPLLKDRSLDVERRLNKAGAELASVEREVEKLKGRIKSFADEVPTILAQLEEEGRKVATALLENARHEAKRIENDAKHQATLAHQRVESDLRKSCLQLALLRAQTKVKQLLSPEEDRRIRQQALDAVVGRK